MAEENKTQEVIKIPIGKLKDLPGMPITGEPEKALGSLVSSIAINGVKEPIDVRQTENGDYQVILGYRRWRAAELARLKEIPARVHNMTEKEAIDFRLNGKTEIIQIEGEGEHKISAIEKSILEKPPQKVIVPEKELREAQELRDKAEEAAERKAKEKTASPQDKPTEPKAADKAPAAKVDKPEAAKSDKPTEGKKNDPPKTEPQAAIAEEAVALKPKTEEKAADKTAIADKTGEKKTSTKTGSKAAATPTEEKPQGKEAVGPVGTAITKVLPDRRNQPTTKDKKDFPKPGEGETFSVTLHPAYLKKSPLNTFSVDRQSDDFQELYKSIQRFGVKDPVLTRIGADGELEILSGQRRHIIASELNYPVPTIIQQLDDDDAKILMADGNLHRETISTYDKAIALKMKAEGMKRKAGRRSKGNTGPKLDTDEALAAEMGMTVAKLNRLMKLSEATEEICGLIDEGKLTVTVAYNIAFLPKTMQDDVAALIGINAVKVNSENTNTLKNLAKTEKLDYNKIKDVLNGKYPPPKVVELPKPASTPSTPSMAPTAIPKSPDVAATANPVTVIPFNPNMEGKQLDPQPATRSISPVAPSVQSGVPAASVVEKGQDRENSYVTKVVLMGDRLRKYFPDVNMTPRAIEESVYEALEERRVRQEKLKQKAEIIKPKGGDAR